MRKISFLALAAVIGLAEAENLREVVHAKHVCAAAADPGFCRFAAESGLRPETYLPSARHG